MYSTGYKKIDKKKSQEYKRWNFFLDRTSRFHNKKIQIIHIAHTQQRGDQKK